MRRCALTRFSMAGPMNEREMSNQEASAIPADALAQLRSLIETLSCQTADLQKGLDDLEREVVERINRGTVVESDFLDDVRWEDICFVYRRHVASIDNRAWNKLK